MYRSTGDAGLTCRQCGSSRPTLRKWLRRYDELGLDGLIKLSRRPINSLNRKIDDQLRAEILTLRKERDIGARRIQIELGLSKDQWLSITIIQRALNQLQVVPLKRSRRPQSPKRYNRPVPGECVQMDTMQIRLGLYQYTAVDDCSRFRVLGLCPRRAGK